MGSGFFKRPIRPIRIVLGWQLIATAVLTLVAALLWGRHAAVSAALGGLINLAAGWVYGWRVSQGSARTAAETLATMFRAWGMKVLVIIAGLWTVLSVYQDIVHGAFFAAFVVTVGLFAAAIAVDDPGNDKNPRPPGAQ